MTTPIVVVNVSQQVAPTPSLLQKTGALISQGGTTVAVGSFSLLTQLSDLTPLLTAAQNLFALSWSASVVTATTSAPHGYPVGQNILLTIAGASPAGYNGTFLCTITSTTSFTYALAVNPGASTIQGVVTDADVAELLQMATTFFSQGSGQSVYVLELGPGDVPHGVTALSNFITATQQFFYSYLVPREWDAQATFLSFLAGFESPTSKTYFFVTTTVATYTNYTNLMKCVYALIEAPGIPSTEFSCASAFYWSLNPNPSSTNKVPPFAFTFVFGVTPYPTKGNAALLTTLKTANINIIGTGAEGGISNTILLWGTMLDGNDFTYWYSVDWVQINIDLAIANAIINGSNNPTNPLYYNQDGINRLQAVAAGLMTSGVTFGLVLNAVLQTELDGNAFPAAQSSGQFIGKTVVNAVPFIPYSKANPGDYKIGKYAGFSIVYTPNRGFIQVIFNVVVSQFIAQ